MAKQSSWGAFASYLNTHKIPCKLSYGKFVIAGEVPLSYLIAGGAVMLFANSILADKTKSGLLCYGAQDHQAPKPTAVSGFDLLGT